MEKGTIICFGDSNTWGYDPETNGRYGSDTRWVDILGRTSGMHTVNVGLNGRQIPHTDAEKTEITALLDDAAKGVYSTPVYFWILLGANDIQMNYGYTAEHAANRMKMLLLDMLWHPAVADGTVSIRVLGPAQTKLGPWSDERCVREMSRIGLQYKLLCKELGIDFTDLGQLDIELASDGDHFSPAGHRAVADFLEGLLG